MDWDKTGQSSTVKGSQLEAHLQVVEYGFNRLDEPVFMAGPQPMLIEFGIHHRLESCVKNSTTAYK